jgi:hypothetical protein
MTKAARATVVFDLGGVLIEWDPRHLYRKLFAGNEAAMEHFLATVCTHEWNRRLGPLAGGAAYQTVGLGGAYFPQQHHWGVAVAKSVLDVSSPVAKASAAALISDCVCARATAARAVASPVCADVASVSVPTPCA